MNEFIITSEKYFPSDYLAPIFETYDNYVLQRFVCAPSLQGTRQLWYEICLKNKLSLYALWSYFFIVSDLG